MSHRTLWISAAALAAVGAALAVGYPSHAQNFDSDDFTQHPAETCWDKADERTADLSRFCRDIGGTPRGECKAERVATPSGPECSIDCTELECRPWIGDPPL